MTTEEPRHASDVDELWERLDAIRAMTAEAKALQKRVNEDRRATILAAVAAGLSQSEVARRLGITQSRVNQIIENTR